MTAMDPEENNFKRYIRECLQRGGSSFLGRGDINDIRSYLLSQRDGISYTLSDRLRKKVLRGSMSLQNFPSMEDVVFSQVKVPL